MEVAPGLDPGTPRGSDWIGRDVLALRSARPGEGLFPEPRRPLVFREAPASDLVPLAGKGTVLFRDVPAGARWRATIGPPEGSRVEPSEFELPPGGRVVLDVRME